MSLTVKQASFLDQFAQARRHAAHMRTVAPEMFPEWQELQGAKRELAAAQAKYDFLQQQWDLKTKE